MYISSWTALTKYPLQEHQCHTTRHTEIATTDQAVNTTRKTKKEETGPDHSLDTANIAAPAIMTCTETAPDHNNGTGTAPIETTQDNSIQLIEDTVKRSCCDTQHRSHAKSMHHSLLGYCSQDCSRSHL